MGQPAHPPNNGISCFVGTHLSDDEIAERAFTYIMRHGEGNWQCADFVSYILDLDTRYDTPSQLFEDYAAPKHRAILRTNVVTRKLGTSSPPPSVG